MSAQNVRTAPRQSKRPPKTRTKRDNDSVAGLQDFWKFLYGKRQGFLALGAITADGNGVWTDGPKLKWPDDAKAAEKWVADHAGFNLFQSVNLFKEPARKNDAVEMVQVLYVDLDHGADKCPVAPSVLVATSPGKSQGYIKLTKPIPATRAQELQRRLVPASGADAGAKDLARVLRVPGTENLKYAKPFKVTISTWNPDRRYDPAKLERLLPPAHSDAGRVTSTAEVFPDGQTNVLLRKFGLRLLRVGSSKQEIRASMTALNDLRAAKKLGAAELDEITEKVLRYSDQLEVAAKGILLADVPPELVKYVAYPYLPLGSAVILSGDPDTNKTTWTIFIGAHVTRGKLIPGMPHTDLKGPRGVVYLSADEPAFVLRNRLEVAGADLSKVLALGRDDPLPSLDDTITLEGMCREVNAALLVLDPGDSFMPRGLDSLKNQDTEAVLSALAKMADRLGLCVIVLRHLAKGERRKVIYRQTGAIAWMGKPRCAVMMFKNPAMPDRRFMAQTKSPAVFGATAVFQIVVTNPEAEKWQQVIRAEFIGHTTDTAQELADAEFEGPSDTPKVALAEAFLKKYLANGEVLTAPMDAAALAEGTFGVVSLSKAKTWLGVVSAPKVFGGPWYSTLPVPDGENGDPHRESVDTAKTVDTGERVHTSGR